MSCCGTRIFEKGRRSGPKGMNSALLQLWAAVLLMDVSREIPRVVVALLRLDMKNEREGGRLTRKHVSAPLDGWLSGEKGCRSAVLRFIHQASAVSQGITFQSGLNRALLEPLHFLLNDQSCSEGLVGIGERSVNIILANFFCELENRSWNCLRSAA